MRRRRFGMFGLERFSGLYLWGLFIVAFGIWSPHVFLTMDTVHSIASSQSVAGILAIAVVIPLACGQFDLSIGANANFVGLLASVSQASWHVAAGPAIVMALAAGILIGAINGFIVIKLGVSSFIATLGMSSVLEAFQAIVTKSEQPVPPLSSFWSDITQTTVGGFQVVFVYLIVVAFVGWWLLAFTPAGRYIYASGANPEAAKLSGIRVQRWSWVTLIIAGGLGGLGGLLDTSLTGPSLTFGAALLLPAFSAAFLGSTQLLPGKFNVWGTVLAIFVLATGVEGLQIVSSAQWVSSMFDGVALIGAVALGVSRRRSVARRAETGDTVEPPDEARDDALLAGSRE